MRNALLLCLALAGCAVHVETVVKIHTNAPSGSLTAREGNQQFLVSGAGEVKLDATRDHVLRLESVGYRPATLDLASHVSAASALYSFCVALPIAPIGLPIWGYFLASGAFDVLEPGDSWVSLVREDEAR